MADKKESSDYLDVFEKALSDNAPLVGFAAGTLGGRALLRNMKRAAQRARDHGDMALAKKIERDRWAFGAGVGGVSGASIGYKVQKRRK